MILNNLTLNQIRGKISEVFSIKIGVFNLVFILIQAVTLSLLYTLLRDAEKEAIERERQQIDRDLTNLPTDELEEAAKP